MIVPTEGEQAGSLCKAWRRCRRQTVDREPWWRVMRDGPASRDGYHTEADYWLDPATLSRTHSGTDRAASVFGGREARRCTSGISGRNVIWTRGSAPQKEVEAPNGLRIRNIRH